MSDHAQSRCIHFSPSLKIVQSSLRVPNKLTLKRLSFHKAIHCFVPLIVAVLEFCRGVLSLVKTESIEDQSHITTPGKFDGIVLAGVRGKSGRAVLAHLKFPTVLVMTQYGRKAGLASFREPHKCGAPLARLNRVCNLLANDIT